MLRRINSMKRITLLFLAGLLLLTCGSLLLISAVRSSKSTITAMPNKTVAVTSPITESALLSGIPSNLNIPSLDLELAIAPGNYNYQTDEWTLSLDKAHFANLTPQPNNKTGNTLIYGHYRKGVFLSLPRMQIGDIAIVSTDNNHKFYYKLNEIVVVKPEDSSTILNYRGDPMLTLQTCSGLFYQNRQLFTFELMRVE